MRLAQHLPEFDVAIRHAIRIARPPEQVYPLARHLDFNASWTTRWLFRLRGLPAEDLRLDVLLGDGPGFAILEERPPQELLIGLMSRGARPVAIDSADAFLGFAPEQGLKITWNFLLTPADGGTKVSTETRVQCLGTATRRIFRLYWLAIRPFSGWIRMEMLRILKRQAEAA